VTSGIVEALRLEEPARGPAVADLLNAFSPTALVFAAITVLTGVISAWLHLGTIPKLWQSEYGQRLLLKLAVLAILAGTGAYNWLRVRPSLGSEVGAARMRRTASIELAVGVLVLMVTAILVATPTATDIAAMNP
ncbi:MAG: copper resistance domain protein, partial [Gemmatimonadetes bacterium]|nr:copper resistance domain protein [Gemmatimonadota bacterium]